MGPQAAGGVPVTDAHGTAAGVGAILHGFTSLPVPPDALRPPEVPAATPSTVALPSGNDVLLLRAVG